VHDHRQLVLLHRVTPRVCACLPAAAVTIAMQKQRCALTCIVKTSCHCISLTRRCCAGYQHGQSRLEPQQQQGRQRRC
jgi:hypothetical protein